MGIPSDLKSCQELIVSQQQMIDDLQLEQEKLRKLLAQMLNGNRSEKRIFSGPNQGLLPFESEEEFQAAQAEAEAEAKTIIEQYTVQRRARKKKPRNESLPSHLERVEQTVEAPEEMKNCPQHGERKIIDYDVTETLMRDPPRLWVLRKKYPKYACPTDPSCGIASPERPTSLVEGNRYDTSIAAAVIEAKWALYLPIYRQQDLFASSGWTPSRSTLLNLIRQSEFVMEPLVDFMTKLVRQDIGIGLDENTAIVVQGDWFEVIGASYVVIYDNQKMIGDAGRFYFLAPGDRYNLAERKAYRPVRQMQPLERVEERPWGQ